MQFPSGSSHRNWQVGQEVFIMQKVFRTGNGALNFIQVGIETDK